MRVRDECDCGSAVVVVVPLTDDHHCASRCRFTVNAYDSARTRATCIESGISFMQAVTCTTSVCEQ
jgi:hypothetical protein